MSCSSSFEETLEKIGGCGIHQWLTGIVIHWSKIVTVFSTLTLVFAGQSPDFLCRSLSVYKLDINLTDLTGISNVGLCDVNGTMTCSSFKFDQDMNTVVSEWDLVCDRKWMTTFVTSLQMLGVLFGCLLSTYLAAKAGSKVTFYSGLVVVVLFNIIGIFSTFLRVYAIIRIIIGIGIGLTTSVQSTLMIEYVPSRLLSKVKVIPSVPLISSCFALVAWWLHDWKMIHILIAVAGIPLVFTYWIVSESFIWCILNDKLEQADKTLTRIAKVNLSHLPDVKPLLHQATSSESRNDINTHDSYGTLFSKQFTVLTPALVLLWFTAGFIYFGALFGVGILFGNLYLNMFLLSIVDAPTIVLTYPLVDRFGRKPIGIFAMSLSSVCGILAGIFQYLDISVTFVVTVLILVCKMMVTSTWIVLMIYTTEIYPSHIGSRGYGFQYTGAILGSIVAPQILLLNDSLPGIFYFISGVLMFMSVFCFAFFRETKDLDLRKPVIGLKDSEQDTFDTQQLSQDKLRRITCMEIP